MAKHGSDSTGNNQGARTRSGRQPNEKHLFGTDVEIGNRTNTLTEWAPQSAAPSFTQIPPQSGSGESVNRAGIGHKSGDLKYSGGIGRP